MDTQTDGDTVRRKSCQMDRRTVPSSIFLLLTHKVRAGTIWSAVSCNPLFLGWVLICSESLLSPHFPTVRHVPLKHLEAHVAHPHGEHLPDELEQRLSSFQSFLDTAMREKMMLAFRRPPSTSASFPLWRDPLGSWHDDLMSWLGLLVCHRR